MIWGQVKATRYLEVKTTLAGCNHFYISKNEVRKAILLGNEWSLVQVLVSPRCLAIADVRSRDIILVRSLTSNQIQAMAPLDTIKGTWVEAARILPDLGDWTPWAWELDDEWSYAAAW